MLQTVNINKTYKNQPVLKDVSIDFTNETGIYGLLGRNGVGKTTLMQIIANQITRYQGQVNFNKENVRTTSQALGQITLFGNGFNKDNRILSEKLGKTVRYYDQVIADFDKDTALALMQHFKLDPKMKYRKLSTGNKTIFQNILGISTRTPVVILDEPTNGLDSVNRKEFFQALMEEYTNHPRLFIISTHLISEVENYLTDIIILKDGKVFVQDTIESLQGQSFRVSNYDGDLPGVLASQKMGSVLRRDIYANINQETLANIRNQGGKVESLSIQTLFNHLVGGDDHE